MYVVKKEESGRKADMLPQHAKNIIISPIATSDISIESYVTIAI